MKKARIISKKIPRKKVLDLRKSIKTHDFGAKRYKILWKKPTKSVTGFDAWGSCDDPSSSDKTILISPNLEEFDFLTTCIDEAIHACNWSLDNDHVDEMSSSISEFLWRIGFRLAKEND